MVSLTWPAPINIVLVVSVIVIGIASPDLLTVVELPKSAPPALKLSAVAYDIKVLEAPVATGTMLRILSSVFTMPLVGPVLTRYLLNGNNVWYVRELASQVPQTVIFKPLPTYELGEEAMARHVSAARATRRRRISPLPPIAMTSRAAKGAWSVEQYAKAYKNKATTPTAVVEALLEARVRLEASLGPFFTEVYPDAVLQQAGESTERWAKGRPLSIWDGVPIAVKEMIDIRGHVTASGTAARLVKGVGNRPAALADDPIVARFRAEGAVIVGQTAMTEWGVTPLGWSMWAQAPRNPHNPLHYSGGSSSGSAVAVATGLVPVAVGFDGGGSIRIPAALSGVVGLACGFGRVPFGCDSTSSMTHAGPLAASARDAALACLLMAGPPPPGAPVDPPHTTTRVMRAVPRDAPRQLISSMWPSARAYAGCALASSALMPMIRPRRCNRRPVQRWQRSRHEARPSSTSSSLT